MYGVEKPTPPTPRKCTLCNAPALKSPEPDGVLRCFGHSIDPLNAAKREVNGQRGKAIGERHRGLTPDQRGAVDAGVISLEAARAKAAEERTKKKGDPDPIPLRTKKDQLAFIERCAGRFVEDGDAQFASGANALVKAALAIMGVEDHDDEEAAPPRTFKFVTTEGRTVAVRGRESPSGN